MKSSRPFCLAIAGALCLAATISAGASTVYEAKYMGTGLPFYSTGNAYGDEIVLGGTDRVLTGFHFAYYSDYAQAGGLQFTIYKNDGPLVNGFASPGTSLFSDTYDVVLGTSGVDVDIPFAPDPANPIPDRLTFVVQFLGNGTAGLLVADAPATIGASGNDFWEFDGANWGLQQLPGYTANFEAKLTAVPEANPGSVATLALAGISLWTVYRRSKRTA
jgi:hypothetical protein